MYQRMSHESNYDGSSDDEKPLRNSSDAGERIRAQLPRHSQTRKRIPCPLAYIAIISAWVMSLIAVAALSAHGHAQYSFAKGYETDLEPLRSVIKVQKIKFKGTLDFDENGTLISTHDRWPEAIQYVGEPSDRIDKAWRDLVRADGVDLDGSEADSIRGKTLQKPSGHWLVGVDGFHQIHCLDMLRKGLRPDYYTNRDPEPIYSTHLYHCLDYLRQSVMCNIDLTPLPVYWDEVRHRPMTNMEVEHTCRDFQAVKGWVTQRNGLNHPFAE